jgi:hypothetical protein
MYDDVTQCMMMWHNVWWCDTMYDDVTQCMMMWHYHMLQLSMTMYTYIMYTYISKISALEHFLYDKGIIWRTFENRIFCPRRRRSATWQPPCCLALPCRFHQESAHCSKTLARHFSSSRCCVCVCACVCVCECECVCVWCVVYVLVFLCVWNIGSLRIARKLGFRFRD